jgi:hypothetical protein
MVAAMNAMDHTTPPNGTAAIRPLPTPDAADVPVLVAALYDEAPLGLRQRLLNHLLRPLGPLALVAVAAGAFARLLPSERWSGVQVHVDDVLGIGADQVLDLALYVQQKAPEMLWGLTDLLSSNPMALGTLSGVLLLAALRARGQPTSAGR